MNMIELIDAKAPFHVSVKECLYMIGFKKAVYDGETLFVSPAMLSLLKDNNSVESVGKAIKIIVIPKIDFLVMPMFSTIAPEYVNINENDALLSGGSSATEPLPLCSDIPPTTTAHPKSATAPKNSTP